MTELGYDLVKIRGNIDPDSVKAQCKKQLADNPTRPGVAESAGLDESDAYWVRKDSVGMPFPECPIITKATKTFTAEEYATCDT